MYLKQLEFTGYSSNRPDYDCKCGFTIAGPLYTLSDLYVKQCCELNIPIILTIKIQVNFLTEYNFRPFNRKEYESNVRGQIEKYMSMKPNIFGWYILPEELRPWRKNEMDFLRDVCSIIREYDSKGGLIMSYNPANRMSNHLFTMSENGLSLIGRNAYLDFNYSNSNSNSIRLRSNFIIQSMNESLKCYQLIQRKNKDDSNNKRIMLGIYLQMAVDPLKTEDDQYISILARHDVFLSVMHGTQMIILWSLFKRESIKRTYGIQYKAYCKAVCEINQTKFDLNNQEDSTESKKRFTLAEILLNQDIFKKTIRRIKTLKSLKSKDDEIKKEEEENVMNDADEMDFSIAEYDLKNVLQTNRKLVLKINSTNRIQALDDEEFEPFQVKYKIV
jgi:hypothetical protein